MINLKTKLLETNLFIDNEYLNLYCELINSNLNTQRVKHKTQRHHIIPKCYYKMIKEPVDNSSYNLVDLLLKDHVMAHCYLVLASKENIFKYYNRISLYKIINHFNYDGIKDLMNNLDEVQLAYEASREIALKYNSMNVPKYKEEHDALMRSEKVRKSISQSMKEYRKTHPFTEEHRRKLSEAAKGNHNCSNPDTRSVECYCVLDTGERYDFHNYKEAGKWWFDTFHPFGDADYAECTFQRKIKTSIQGNPITFGGGKNKIHITNIKWYKKETIKEVV